MVSVTMVVQLVCQVREDRDVSIFVGRCPSLDLYSQGETEEEAIEAIKSAIGMYLSASTPLTLDTPDGRTDDWSELNELTNAQATTSH